MQNPERIQGAKAVAYRIVAAEERFIDYCRERGFTRSQAEKILRVYRKARVIKIDPIGGQFTFKHGAFDDLDVLQRAADSAE